MKDSIKKTLDNILFKTLPIVILVCFTIIFTGLIVQRCECEFLNIVVYGEITIGYIGAIAFLLSWIVITLTVMAVTFAESNMSLRTVLWNTDAPGLTIFFILGSLMFALMNYALYLTLTSPVSEVIMHIMG